MKKNSIYVLLLIGFALFVYRHIFTFRPVAFGDLIYLYPQNLLDLLSPVTYALAPGADGFGINLIPTLWIYWTFLPFAILQSVFSLPFAISFPILFSLPFLFFSVFSIFKMGDEIQLSIPAKVLAALFYLLNSYILMVVDGGQIGIAYAYCFFPLCLYFIMKAFRDVTFVSFLFATLTFSILTFLDLRVALLTLIVTFLFVIYTFSEILGKIKKILLFAVPSILFLICIHSFWILPIYFFPSSLSQFAQSSGEFSQLSFFGIFDSLLLFQPHYPLNEFGNLQMISLPYAIVSILVFVHLLFQNKRKILFFDFCALIAIFLTKGVQYPFGFVNEFLFTHIVGFNLFRDPSKFMIITALCYSLLLGVSYDRLRAKFLKFGQIFFGLVCLILFFALVPLLQRTSAGLLTAHVYSPLWEELAHRTFEERSFFRRIWVPERPVFGYSDNQHPGLIAKNMSETALFHFLNDDKYDRFHFIYNPLIASYFDIFGIGEIVVDKTVRHEQKLSEKAYIENLEKYFHTQTWLKTGEITQSYSQYKNDDYFSRLYFAKDLYLVEGGFERMYDLFAIDKDFIKKGIYSYPRSSENITNYSNYKNVVTLRSKSDFDLRLQDYLQKKNIALQPSQKAWGQMPDRESWRSLLKEKSIKTWDIATEDLFQDIYYSNISGETLVFDTKEVGTAVYFKLFYSTQGGEIQVKVANQNLTFKTKKSTDSFQWVEIPFGATIEVKNIKGFNAVRDFLVVNDKSEIMKSSIPAIGSLVYMFNTEQREKMNVGSEGEYDITLVANPKQDRMLDLFRNDEKLASFRSSEGLNLRSIYLEAEDVLEVKNNDLKIDPLYLHFNADQVQSLTKNGQVIETKDRVEYSRDWHSFETTEIPLYENKTYSIALNTPDFAHYKVRVKYFADEHFLFEKEIVDGIDEINQFQRTVLVPRAATRCTIEILWVEENNMPEFTFIIESEDMNTIITHALFSADKAALERLFSNDNISFHNWKVKDRPNIDLKEARKELDGYSYLVLTDRYDTNWRLKTTNGTAIEPFQVNGLSQAFLVSDTGDLDELIYVPQDLVDRLFLVSLLSGTSLLALIGILKLRKMNLTKKEHK